MIDRNDTHGAPPACRVLVVDDDRVHRAYARCVFEAFGCDVGLAVDGLEAIRLARETAFDIIL
ncbi:MAG TPA: hypothetical protein VHW60_23605, partial [Caulobacteraceae bacterium]|nr:hypothetical protein [Caulobacteraceae bacterium]